MERNLKLSFSKKKLILISFTIFILAALYNSDLAAQTISSFSPESGPVGTSITISGSGFNTTAANNIVYFGTVKAAVTTASATSLTVTVPAGYSNQNISVTNLANNLTAYSSKPFNVTFPNSCILQIAPKVDIPISAQPYNFTDVSDLNGDGKPDIAYLDRLRVRIMMNNSSPGYVSFSAAVTIVTSSGYFENNSVRFGDLDGDGKPDMVVTNGSFAGISYMSVYRNTSTFSTISFSFVNNIETGFYVSYPDLTIGDLNQDGKPEIITANTGNGFDLSVFRNTSTIGNISFDARVRIEMNGSPKNVKIGDLDGDSKPDMAVTAGTDLFVFRNTSSGDSLRFVSYTFYQVGRVASYLKIEDYNGDNKPDISFADSYTNILSVFRNTSTIGNISLAAKIDFATGSNPRGLSSGDLDGDGKPDLAVNNRGSSTVSVFRNISSGSVINFESKADYTTGANTNPEDILIADFDVDGKADIAATLSSSKIAVLRNAAVSSVKPNLIGNGNIIPNGSVTPNTSNHTDFGHIIYNGNLIRTFTIKNTSTDSFTVSSIMVTGPDSSLFVKGALTPAGKIAPGDSASFTVNFTPVTTGLKTSTIKIISFDTCSQMTYTFALQGTGNIYAFTSFSPESGPIGTSVNITGSIFSTTPSNNVVYFGAERAAVTASTQTGLTVTVPAGADFRFITATNLESNLTVYSRKPFAVTFFACPGPDFAGKVDFAIGTFPNGMNIGDLDSDGKPDIALFGNDFVSVLRNTSTTGGLTFETKVDFASGSGPFSMSLGDIDGDGKLDMAVVNSNDNTVSVFRNTSTSGIINSGSFAARVNFVTGTYPSSVSIGDIDGDGKPDIAVTNLLNNNVSVFLNTSSAGNINFASSVNLGTGSHPISISIGDIDGDGKPDLAVVSSSNATVSILRNTSTQGSVSFAAKVDHATGTSPRSVNICDIDNDGKQDVIMVNTTGASVSVLRNTSNTGSISLAAKVDFTTGASPRSVSIGDLDGDGKPDMSVSNENSNSISVFQNISVSGIINSGSFALKVDFATSNNPQDLSAADLDGDGKPELSTVHSSGNGVSVLKNLASGSPLTEINLKGNSISIPDGSVTPDTANHTDFGSVFTGGNIVRTFTIQNTGTDSLNINSITMTGPDSVLFAPGAMTPAGKIMPGNSATFTITFSAPSTGVKTAKVNISSTDCDERNYDFAVKGTGSSSIINISVIPEGFYNTGTNILNRSDTVKTYLHSNVSPYAVIDSAVSVIDSLTFTAAFVYENAASGTYYIRMSHRNTIETWSKDGGEVFTAGSMMNFDFTTAASQAFGDNMKQVDTSPLRFAIFSGDVNQDGIVDGTDAAVIDNDAYNFITGYVISDLYGDEVTDGSDAAIADNNVYNFVGKVTP